MKNQQYTVNLNFDEINSLVKLILYIKFESNDDDLLLYAGSPLINSSLEKLLFNHLYYKDRLDDFFQEIPEDTKAFIERKIEADELQGNLEIDERVKLQLLSNCAYPYKLSCKK